MVLRRSGHQPTRRLPFAAAWVACLVAVGGCISIKTTGADTVGDFGAEAQYNAVYAEHMTVVARDNQAFAASGSNPGVCNKGGTNQGCYDADATVIQDYQALLDALKTTPVPPRFADADRQLRAAVAQDIAALQLRNQAIAQNDDAAWKQHQVVLQQGLTMFQDAYAAFPEDNRPQPPP